jgi:glutamate synthase domain-containing protein 2
MIQQRVIEGISHDKAVLNYIKGLNKGILKVMSKMGISTLQSYCGAQIFEAIGLNQTFVDRFFTHTTSRIGGIGVDIVAEEVRLRHERAFARRLPMAPAELGALESGHAIRIDRDVR